MGVAVYADDLSLKTQRVGQGDVVEGVKAFSSAEIAGFVKKRNNDNEIGGGVHA